MSVLRLGAILMLTVCFGIFLSEIVSIDVDPMETRSTTMNLCDSGGRRPCP